MSNKSTAQNAVVKFPERVKKSASETARKWGKPVVDHGFTIVPSLLLKAQARLNITATEMAVLLQIMDHWWDSGKMPYPGKKLLADRLGMQPRQIQRHTASMEEKGLLDIEDEVLPAGTRRLPRRKYSVSGSGEWALREWQIRQAARRLALGVG